MSTHSEMTQISHRPVVKLWVARCLFAGRQNRIMNRSRCVTTTHIPARQARPQFFAQFKGLSFERPGESFSLYNDRKKEMRTRK